MDFIRTGWKENFWEIFFPSRCLGCRETLQYSKWEILCPICRHHAMISDTHLMDNHPLKKRLISEFPFQLILSKYRFPNNSELISNMIYGLKYQNLLYVGHLEGEDYGEMIRPLLLEKGVTAMVPTPLHWRKQIQRGYNQSLEFAKGLARSTQLPIYHKLIHRVKPTRSQTSLNKAERKKNMKYAFQVHRPQRISLQDDPPHFLLVDDVVTSGVTLSEMAHSIKKVFPQALCSVCTLAYKDYS